MERKRIDYLNYLKVLATLGVIIIHLIGEFWVNTNTRSFGWNVANFFESLTRGSVPIFVMISGALFLSRDLSIEKLYKKYILRLVVAYVLWSAFYAVAFPVGKAIVVDGFVPEYKVIISNFIGGWYHMWFIPMIIGLYMCVPLIRLIVKSERITGYFLVLSFIFTLALPWIVSLAEDFAGEIIFEHINLLNGLVSYMTMDHVRGYTFYFVLGHWINNASFNRQQRTWIYILGVFGFAVSLVLSSAVAWKTGIPSQTYYQYLSLNIALGAIAVFTLFKHMNFKNEKANYIVSKLSKYSFGAYLVHAFVISMFEISGITVASFNTLISVPVLTIVVAVISFAGSIALNKIPKLNSWIV